MSGCQILYTKKTVVIKGKVFFWLLIIMAVLFNPWFNPRWVIFLERYYIARRKYLEPQWAR